MATSSKAGSRELKPLISNETKYRYKPKVIKDYIDKINKENGKEPRFKNAESGDPISDMVLTLCSAAKSQT